MNNDAIEKYSSGGSVGVPNRKKDVVKRMSREEFEAKAFNGGVYHFDFDKDVRELEMDVTRTRDWYHSAHWDERRTADGMVREINDARYALMWRKQFDGQIPARWINWINISNDFEEAGKLGLQLSDGLINAGVTHPHHLVANEVGKSQKLNMTQLVAVLARPGIPGWNEQQIISVQTAKGLTQKELREAQRRANAIKEKMKQEQKGKPQLRDTLPELTEGVK